VLIAVALLVAPSLSTWSPFLVWNTSPSVPVGLYRIDRTAPGVGDLVLARLTGPLASLANRRGYLSRTVYVLKPVFAVAGDRVCRFGSHIFVRRRLAVLALGNDSARRTMPSWHGCRTLQAGQLFLLAGDPASFDSRYFGPLRTEHVAGRAARHWPRRFPD
jgi:conjugative transfer signal peptidase TraF